MEQMDQVLKKLDDIDKSSRAVEKIAAELSIQQASHDKRLDKIDSSIADLSIQNRDIVSLQKQVKVLFGKNDELTHPEEGSIARIKRLITDHVANCPRQQVKRIWWALALLTTVLTGAFLTLMYNSIVF